MARVEHLAGVGELAAQHPHPGQQHVGEDGTAAARSPAQRQSPSRRGPPPRRTVEVELGAGQIDRRRRDGAPALRPRASRRGPRPPRDTSPPRAPCRISAPATRGWRRRRGQRPVAERPGRARALARPTSRSARTPSCTRRRGRARPSARRLRRSPGRRQVLRARTSRAYASSWRPSRCSTAGARGREPDAQRDRVLGHELDALEQGGVASAK